MRDNKLKKPLGYYGAGLLILATWLGCVPVQAQHAAPWPVTLLDSVVSVSMPYAGSLAESKEFEAIGLRLYVAPTSDNQFAVLAFTPKPEKPLKPGQELVIDPNQIIAALLTMPDKLFTKSKRQASYLVTMPTAPGGHATHQVYNGFDAFHQLPARMELTWVIRNGTLYLFSSTYSLPQEKDSAEDLQRFFSSIIFKASRP